MGLVPYHAAVYQPPIHTGPNDKLIETPVSLDGRGQGKVGYIATLFSLCIPGSWCPLLGAQV